MSRGIKSIGITGVAACALALGAPASANTFKPTRFDDPTPNDCKPNDCSLREALAAANGQAGPDEVVLREGTYELEIPGDQPSGGSLDIFSKAELRGQGAGKTKIDANGLDRPMSIGCGVDFNGAITIKRLTLKGGAPGANEFNCTGQGNQSIGGGLLAMDEKVTLQGVVIKGNEAAFGGGIESGATKLTLQGVVIKGNEAAFGGGIESGATKLTIQNSTISGNNAAEGGGLDIRSGFTQPVIDIRSSTISGNTAGKGGGILADGLPDFGEVPKVKLTNSTVAGNDASNDGGGIMGDNAAEVTLDNSTVAYNEGNSDDVGTAVGGGVFQHSGALFALDDTLVAGNLVGQGGDGEQCAGSFSAQILLVQNQAGVLCNLTGTSQSIADAVIGPLAKNGGPTKTVGLLAGSPAINHGAESCPDRDQRGEKRPANDDKCDTGAFEHRPSDP